MNITGANVQVRQPRPTIVKTLVHLEEEITGDFILLVVLDRNLYFVASANRVFYRPLDAFELVVIYHCVVRQLVAQHEDVPGVGEREFLRGRMGVRFAPEFIIWQLRVHEAPTVVKILKVDFGWTVFTVGGLDNQSLYGDHILRYIVLKLLNVCLFIVQYHSSFFLGQNLTRVMIVSRPLLIKAEYLDHPIAPDNVTPFQAFRLFMEDVVDVLNVLKLASRFPQAVVQGDVLLMEILQIAVLLLKVVDAANRYEHAKELAVHQELLSAIIVLNLYFYWILLHPINHIGHD